MIVVRVELHSAITRKVTELARMSICNVGGTSDRGDYSCTAYRGRSKAQLDAYKPQRSGHLKNYPRLKLHVWHLVARALAAMNYIDASVRQPGVLEAGHNDQPSLTSD